MCSARVAANVTVWHRAGKGIRGSLQHKAALVFLSFLINRAPSAPRSRRGGEEKGRGGEMEYEEEYVQEEVEIEKFGSPPRCPCLSPAHR